MKIVFTIFVLPNELDDLERVLTGLNLASKYVDGTNYEFYISLGLDDYLIDWNASVLEKDFFLNKFKSLKQLTHWANNSTFQVRDEILGSLSNKIYAHRECDTATHFVWLDSDICFDEKILIHIENSINVIEQNNISAKYIISPEIVRYWDTTWDCLVNSQFKKKPLNYCKSNNPFIDSGEKGDVTLETVSNTHFGQPNSKFGAGWFNCISKALLDRIQIPESMGHYGFGDDTFLMWAIDKINKIDTEQIYQFKLKNYVVCENFSFRDRSYYNEVLSMINRKDEFTKIANDNFKAEYNKLK